MTRRKSRNDRARHLAKVGGRLSVRQRLKHTMKTADSLMEMLGKTNVENMELRAEVQASRFAVKWYRRRWIFTMLALIMVVLAVAGVLVLG